MYPRHPEHLKAFDYLGVHAYFLTFCTAQRQKAFTEDAHVELVLSQIRRATRDQCFALTAYCFMPDHVHLLVEGRTHDADLRIHQGSKAAFGISLPAGIRRRLVATIRV